ncbi:MAG: biotin transporter BioY [Oscillospiraceae bacterium]|nr:biotin transporter BioY [Oscillospiraceae bacterium]
MGSKTLKINSKIRDMCFIAVFSAAAAVLAQVQLPGPGGVPFTMQTFAVLLAGVVLGAKKGALAIVIYVLLGAAGIPVFAGFTGGFGRIVGHTGGYILSFPVMALFAGIGSNLQNRLKNIWQKNAVLAGGIVFGTAINFLCGMVWGMFVLNINASAAFAGFVAPFIVTSAIQTVLAGGIGVSVKIILKKAQVLL